jgi:23S rRNA (cytidine2498-2'-O)-methyltransferase
VTFKHAGVQPVDEQRLAERHWTFAHAHGISLGRVTGDKLEELAEKVWKREDVSRLAAGDGFAAIHVWQVGPHNDDFGGDHYVTPLCEVIEAALQGAAPASCVKLRSHSGHSLRPAPRNCRVLDVIVLAPGEWWIGHHRAVRRHERWAGGAIPAPLPEHAVSRAYAKMVEALAWSDLPLAPEDECVEIGCAPGGASQALLDRGLFVTGIDPADVDSSVLGHPRFRHLKKRGKDVRRKEFEGVRWLAADMNVAPEATLDEVEAIVTQPSLTIRGTILTLKLSDWTSAVKLPQFVARVRGWGYRDVRTRQLTTGGQEVCLVALKRKALRRVGAKLNRKRRSRGRETHRKDEAHSTLPGPHF